MFINRDAPSLGRDENLVHDSVVCGRDGHVRVVGK